MKIAIILIGNIRTWEYCQENFLKTFSKYNPHIYAAVDELQYGHHPAIQGRISDSQDIKLTQDEIIQKFENVRLQKLLIFPRITENFDKVHSNFRNLESCFSQVEKLWVTMNNLNEQYDFIIKTRCDMMYTDVEVKFDPNKLIIDSGNVYPNDCILISSHDMMYKLAETMLSEFFQPKYNDSHTSPPHTLLKNAIHYNNFQVETMKLMDCVVRKGNKKEYY